jgi:hypothetical protein
MLDSRPYDARADAVVHDLEAVRAALADAAGLMASSGLQVGSKGEPPALGSVQLGGSDATCVGEVAHATGDPAYESAMQSVSTLQNRIQRTIGAATAAFLAASATI